MEKNTGNAKYYSYYNRLTDKLFRPHKHDGIQKCFATLEARRQDLPFIYLIA